MTMIMIGYGDHHRLFWVLRILEKMESNTQKPT